MATYRNAIVALDMSDESEYIYERALKLLLSTDTLLSIAHVFVPIPDIYYFEAPMTDYVRLQEEHRKDLGKILYSFVASKSPELPSQRMHFLSSNPARELRQFCEDIDADLLVIGSHGHGAFKALLGSQLPTLYCMVLNVMC